MRILNIVLFFVLSSLTFAQIDIRYLNDVPEEFKEKYYSQKRDYNPLQVGNMWQYYDAEYNVYSTIKVLQDSIINGKRYFKKSSFPEFTTKPDANISWERNDTISGVSFMLDFEDVNNNGDFLEELPLDSLENPYWSRYKTFKYSFGGPRFWSGEKTVLIVDSNWVRIEGDTVISRTIEILELFWEEEIIEKFGIFWNWSESPARYCTGAIINGKQYGTIVSVDENVETKPTRFLLGNNYPNPFNPSTTITYSIPQLSSQSLVKIRLLVYDNLGRVITTLVNENKSSGTYSITFNAEGLASGVYYYSLISESNVITKPMLLIK
ncbi:MAG: T9SS type A sorting domain-containing protein [Melioribacteraceae bacterium]|nr:T9SS type A sorting domain-containing protein [Melioribacteraceae bacterium]